VAALLLVPIAALATGLSASASYACGRLQIQDPGLLRFVRLIGVMIAVVLGGELVWVELETLTLEGLRAGASVAGAR
jgi:hypothetical protein